MPNNFAQEAQDIVRKNPDSVHYFLKFGTSDKNSRKIVNDV
jgi:hypothetical protein